MPNQWIDKETGHKVVRLSTARNQNGSFYFNNYCPLFLKESNEGDLMVYYGSVADKAMGNQLFTVNLKTLETKQLTNHKAIAGEMVCAKTSEAYLPKR